MKRRKMSKSKSKKLFKRTASKTHRLNLPKKRAPMRGGIRLQAYTQLSNFQIVLMKCVYPVSMYRFDGKLSAKADPRAKRESIPCGQCIACRLSRSHEWTIRMVNEAHLHETNSFVTLTYSDDNLPPELS